MIKILFELLLLTIYTVSGEIKPVNDDDATEYLVEFGYADASNLVGQCEKGKKCEADTENILEKAVKKFQKFAKLPETGVLDIKTKKKMAIPRCGIQDVEELNMPGAEKPKWNKPVVTFKFQNFSPQIPQAKLKEAVQRAYDTWAAVIPVKFKETTGQADINIVFGAKNHGDTWPFDGRGKVLAHATAPTDGKLHFDEDERWTIGPENPQKLINQEYTDFFPVALHEGGHTLGLKHSDDPDAIMAPFSHEWVDASGKYITPKLKPNDIKMIQELYGKGSGPGVTTKATTPKSIPPRATTPKPTTPKTTTPKGRPTTRTTPRSTTRRTTPPARPRNLEEGKSERAETDGSASLLKTLLNKWFGD